VNYTESGSEYLSSVGLNLKTLVIFLQSYCSAVSRQDIIKSEIDLISNPRHRLERVSCREP